eukprot:scaffold39118_cov206-Skeletonema_marinoi.AAC.14
MQQQRLGDLFKCDLCGTQQSGSYGQVFDIGTCCHRCSLLSLGGPDMVHMPHCPPVPSDVDPAIIAIQQNRDPVTEEDFDSWVLTLGNQFTGIDRVREIFTGEKLKKWFEIQGDSIDLGFTEEPVTYEVFEACARKHPPSNFECPGISVLTARRVVAAMKALIFCAKCRAACRSNKRCSRCKKTVYCSRDCQRNDWKVHKKTCKEAVH